MVDESGLPRRPEDWASFRWGHLLLVLESWQADGRRNLLTLDRIAFYDFFSAHPFLIFKEDDEPVRRELVAVGLQPRSLTYASAPHRLANRRQLVQTDIAALVSRRLVAPNIEAARIVYRLSAGGEHMASTLGSLHALAIRTSAGHVISTLDKLTDRALQNQAAFWTDHNALLIDILETE